MREEIAYGLSFPTSLAFDAEGTPYVAESGLPFRDAPPGGRVWRVESPSQPKLLAEGLRPPVNGLVFHEHGFYVSEGGHPGRISRLELDGERTTIVDRLPGPGNYHVNTVAIGPDRRLYFGQGAMTNTGIVGLDAYELGWLRRLPHAHDVPGYDVELAGINVETENPLGEGRATTGAFVPFGTVTKPGQSVQGQIPCTAAVMSCEQDGSGLELVAWGLRNAYGLGFLDGRLLALDQGADERGSRPVAKAPDALFEVRQGAWYGWPDYVCGDPITDDAYRPARAPAPAFLLENHHELPRPERPLVRFPPHVAATKFDVGPDGKLVVALFGDEAPMTAPEGSPHVGRTLAVVDPTDWSLAFLGAGPLARPIDARFGPDGVLYVVDFGQFEIGPRGIEAQPATGAVWRVP